jgi:hypothetical protein
MRHRETRDHVGARHRRAVVAEDVDETVVGVIGMKRQRVALPLLEGQQDLGPLRLRVIPENPDRPEPFHQEEPIARWLGEEIDGLAELQAGESGPHLVGREGIGGSHHLRSGPGNPPLEAGRLACRGRASGDREPRRDEHGEPAREPHQDCLPGSAQGRSEDCNTRPDAVRGLLQLDVNVVLSRLDGVAES